MNLSQKNLVIRLQRLEIKRLKAAGQAFQDSHNQRGSDGPCNCQECRGWDAAK